MGMYDTVIIKCWQCGEEIQLQSKSGDCILKVYKLEETPADVLGDIIGETGNCPNCGAIYKVNVRISAWIT